MSKRDRLVWRVELARKTVADAEAAYDGVRQSGRLPEAKQALRDLENSRALLADHERALAIHDGAERLVRAAGEPQAPTGGNRQEQ